MKIDITHTTNYDNGKDPDADDPILRDHHKMLWNKPLPNGKMFDLTVSSGKPYKLFHASDLGNFTLSSDSIVHSYSRLKNRRMSEIVGSFPKEEIDRFYKLACTIGGYIIFPANKVNGMATINGLRGMDPKIKDRFDLTLECIRRWYINENSPLSDCLNRYGDFFKLFTDFNGYVEFFLLQDMVDTSGNIRFWLPFGDFGVTHPLPSNVNEYREYMKNASDFVNARNRRMDIMNSR